MKKCFLGLVLVAGLTACNNNGSTTEVKVDSLKKELDTLGEKIDEKADKLWDSTREKAKDLKESIEARFDSVKKEKKDTSDK